MKEKNMLNKLGDIIYWFAVIVSILVLIAFFMDGCWDKEVPSSSKAGRTSSLDFFIVQPAHTVGGAQRIPPPPKTPPTIFEMNVSGYCRKSCCCGKFADGITASGKPAIGFFVAAPPEYAFGTEMQIPGYADGQWVKVEDRGGAIKGNKIDVFFDDKDGVSGHQRALNWGRKILNVKVRVKI